MKTVKKTVQTLVLVSILILLTTLPATAQMSIEAHGGLGYATVDIDEWTGRGAYDWSNFMKQGYAQFFFTQLGNIQVGAEVGYQYFFWSSVRIPYGYTTIYRTYEADAIRIMLVGRLPFGEGGFFTEFGPALYMFGEYTDFGIAAALGYLIEINDKMYIPIKFKTALIFEGEYTLVPLGVTAGFGYRLGN